VRPALFALALGAAAALGGCGGDDDGGLTTGDVSKAAYIADADAICAEGDREIEAAARERFADKPPSDDEAAAFLEDVVAPSIQGQLDELRQLEVPEADVEAVERVYDTAQENLDTLRETPEDFTGDANPFAEANRLARAYGFEDCGS
jgi:hypothetical protein